MSRDKYRYSIPDMPIGLVGNLLTLFASICPQSSIRVSSRKMTVPL